MSSSNHLHQLIHSAADPARLDETIHIALSQLSDLIPYDLAAFFECTEGELKSRLLKGRFAARITGNQTLDLQHFPQIQRAFELDRPWILSESDHEHEGDPWDGILDLAPGHSCMVLPIQAGGERLGLITLDREACGSYDENALVIAEMLGKVLAQALRFTRQSWELDILKSKLEEENRVLRMDSGRSDSACTMLEQSTSPAMRVLVSQSKQASRSSLPLLILGETGTGKEVLARAIHEWSMRSKGSFVALNCAAIPATLIESELFGHVKGAFSGAGEDRPGRFLAADGGTLLLDEVGELPLEAQAKMLRILQEGEVTPLGSDRTRRVDVRIVAATHVNLADAVRQGRFREDLYYRLNVVPLMVPPLRDRPEDLEAISRHLLTQNKRAGVDWRLSQDALEWIKTESWPGNIRQLRNSLERACIFCRDGWITKSLLQPVTQSENVRSNVSQTVDPLPDKEKLVKLDEWNRRYILHVLESCQGRIYGAAGAASLLGLKPSTLQSRMKKLGIERNNTSWA